MSANKLLLLPIHLAYAQDWWLFGQKEMHSIYIHPIGKVHQDLLSMRLTHMGWLLKWCSIISTQPLQF